MEQHSDLAPDPSSNSEDNAPGESIIQNLKAWFRRVSQTAPRSTPLALLLCISPILMGFAFPHFWIQILCVIWGIGNIVLLGHFLLHASDIGAGRRLVISFLAVISVTQAFGSAYAATLLSSDHYRHFRFSEYSTASDFNNQRLATQLLTEIHTNAIFGINQYVQEQIDTGVDAPAGFPFDFAMRTPACPNEGLAFMVWYTCGPDSTEDTRALYKAEWLLPLLFETTEYSDTQSILRTRDTRQSVVALTTTHEPYARFLRHSGASLSVFFYESWTQQDVFANPYRRRDMIEHFAAIAKTSLRENPSDNPALIPFSYTPNLLGSDRFRNAVVNTLICFQEVSDAYMDGPCTPPEDLAPLAASDGWSAPDAKPGVLMTTLRPLDYVLQAYLSEMLYWDVKLMETANNRRDLVANGMLFSAMAVMTSGFSDMSPQSYLAKTLLALQFLTYIILILLILPMSMERPRDAWPGSDE